MRITVIIFLCIAICFSLGACDAGLRVVGFELVTYPHKLFYVIGVDSEIDIDGGTVQIVTIDDKKHPERMRADQMSYSRLDVEHEIDFSTEGIYLVTVSWSPDFFVAFPVQVVSLDEIRRIAELEVEN
ncbi:MAG: hypothetical protein FWG42_07645 [Clostridiales bacterium]|nr:hypothetical protein [Clostridiales bacterium]